MPDRFKSVAQTAATPAATNSKRQLNS